MNFAGTILYVRDVRASLSFYEKAFGLETVFVSDDASFGALKTGPTLLGFATLDMSRKNFASGVAETRPGAQPPAFEIWLSTDDVARAFDKAVKAGCAALSKPEKKPWGQTVAFVKDADGHVVEISTPWTA